MSKLDKPIEITSEESSKIVGGKKKEWNNGYTSEEYFNRFKSDRDWSGRNHPWGKPDYHVEYVSSKKKGK